MVKNKEELQIKLRDTYEEYWFNRNKHRKIANKILREIINISNKLMEDG